MILTVHDDFVSCYAAAVLRSAAAVAAVRQGGSVGTEGKADAIEAGVAPLAADDVLLEDVTFSGSLEKRAIARPVVARLGEVSNEVLLHAPSAGRHEVQNGDRH